MSIKNVTQRAAVRAHLALAGADMRKTNRFATAMRLAATTTVLLTAMVEPASAQSLKASATSIFLWIYGTVGVFGAIAIAVTGLNWATGNWLGREDPRKTFFQVLLGTGVALGSVAVIQWLKDTVGANANDINSL